MINWIKRLFGMNKPEPEHLQEVPHFHIDRHPEINAFDKHPDFSEMSKLELDIWARNEIDLKLDRRRTKDYMIEQIQSHLNKEN